MSKIPDQQVGMAGEHSGFLRRNIDAAGACDGLEFGNLGFQDNRATGEAVSWRKVAAAETLLVSWAGTITKQ